MERLIHIYALCEPGTEIIRYIGQTTNIKFRMNGHWGESRIYNSPKCCWLRSLKEKGQSPSIKVLTTVALSQASEAEKKAIQDALDAGMKLLNVHKHAAGSLAVRTFRIRKR